MLVGCAGAAEGAAPEVEAASENIVVYNEFITPSENEIIEEEEEIVYNTAYIFIGDSRTVGIQNVCDIADDNIFYICKVSMGWYWLESTALPRKEEIKALYPEYDRWVIMTNLGVNDLGNLYNYIGTYTDQMMDHEDEVWYFISVNPVNEQIHHNVKNATIDNFNSVLQELPNFVDTASILLTTGFESSDGLHYSATTNRLIYDTVLEEVGYEY